MALTGQQPGAGCLGTQATATLAAVEPQLCCPRGSPTEPRILGLLLMAQKDCDFYLSNDSKSFWMMLVTGCSGSVETFYVLKVLAS